MNMFVEDFDCLEPAMLAQEPAVPDLSARLAAEYERGLAEGEGRGLEACEDAARQLTARCDAEFPRAEAALAAMAEAAAEQVARLVFEALGALVPSVCAACGPAEVAALTRVLLPRLKREPQIRLRLNPHDAAAVQVQLAALDDDLGDRIVVTQSDQIARGDLRVAWQDGALLRDTGAIWRQMSDALRQFGFLDTPHEPGARSARPVAEQVAAHAG